jgi:hypothetical protein
MKLYAATIRLHPSMGTYIEYALAETIEAAREVILERAFAVDNLESIEEIPKDYVSLSDLNAFSASRYGKDNHPIRWGQDFLNHFDHIKSVKALRWGSYLWEENDVNKALYKIHFEAKIVDHSA